MSSRERGEGAFARCAWKTAKAPPAAARRGERANLWTGAVQAEHFAALSQARFWICMRSAVLGTKAACLAADLVDVILDHGEDLCGFDSDCLRFTAANCRTTRL